MSIWDEIKPESEKPEFWICYHACMLFLHGIINLETFNSIYDRYGK